MKLIPLTQGQHAIVDDEDYDFLMQWKWFYDHGYAKRNEFPNGKRRRVHMHRVILPGFPFVDHINRNSLDNRRSNLRPCTRATNNLNQGLRKDNRSGYKGVSKHYNYWRVTIQINGQYICKGKFTDVVEAARFYDALAREYHGEFAYLNFPEEQHHV